MTSQYHHHNYNECLRQEIGDEGTGHSPVYGYAGDGYPVHGPYHSSTQIAESCWFKRDYSSATSATGCGAVGERTCTLNDNLDVSAGTSTASAGASTSELVGIDYNTDIAAVTGTYFQDFYYEATCTAQGDAYLDEHNGHDHDGLGYHYHATVESITDFTPKFPLLHGPDYKGDAGGSFNCDDGTGGPPP